MPHPETWLRPTPAGLFCEPGGFFIDPGRPVERAVITHGHADHARPGHAAVLATPETLAIMRARMGRGRRAPPSSRCATARRCASARSRLRLVPAGHVLGSAQVVLEWRGSRAVVSGDYKRQPDATCAPFEPVACDVFVTEATFALPVFRHPPPAHEIAKLLHSLALFPERTHVVGCYALGKCQRLITLLRAAGWDRPIHLHGAQQTALPAVRGAGRPARRAAAGDGRQQGGAEGRHRPRPALGHRRPLGPAAGRAGHRRRQRLDAGAPAGQDPRRRAAAGHQRPCRLGRAEPHHRRDRRARGLGHPWPRRRADPCPGPARHPRPGAAPDRPAARTRTTPPASRRSPSGGAGASRPEAAA